MYQPVLARFASRDPLPLDGPILLGQIPRESTTDQLHHEPPYAYARNNPVTRIDPSGLQSLEEAIEDFVKRFKLGVRNAKNAFCRAWVAKQKKDLDWLKDLPDCPCSECDVAHDNKSWTPPEDADQKYHPGAEKCSRSITAKGPGQQCCYKGHELITSGLGAGTPDKYAPVGAQIELHWDNDVIPYEMCKAAGRELRYLQARPPNNGNKCEAQPS